MNFPTLPTNREVYVKDLAAFNLEMMENFRKCPSKNDFLPEKWIVSYSEIDANFWMIQGSINYQFNAYHDKTVLGRYSYSFDKDRPKEIEGMCSIISMILYPRPGSGPAHMPGQLWFAYRWYRETILNTPVLSEGGVCQARYNMHPRDERCCSNHGPRLWDELSWP
jgi:hypothetical protein